jgi:predicted nucleic acid-binding protein
MGNSNYDQKASSQAQQSGTSLMKRLTNNHLALKPETQQTLLAQGISESMLPMLAAGCLSINVPPNLLRYTHNVPVVVNTIKLITELGYRPGEDFYVSVFKSNVNVPDENGEPTDNKTKAPTVVVMTSSARIEENAKQDDRMRNLTHVVETGIVTDEKEAEAIFNENFKDNRKSFRDCIIAWAELYTYHAKTGAPLGSGRPQVFYGFYLPWKIFDNKEVVDYNETGKAMDNHEGPQIARKRAANKAWRAVSRVNVARDDRSADMRLASMMETAQLNLAKAEKYADEFGMDMDDAIVDGESYAVLKREEEKPITIENSSPVRQAVSDLEELFCMFDEVDVVVKKETELDKLFRAIDERLSEEHKAYLAELRAQQGDIEMKPAQVDVITQALMRIGQWGQGELIAGYHAPQLLLGYMTGEDPNSVKPGPKVKYLVPVIETLPSGDANKHFDMKAATAVWGIAEALKDVVEG